jgi:hypothetical protein
MAKDAMSKIGVWAFIVGVIIAIIAGFWQLSGMVASLLMVIGLIVGFLNVQGKESSGFLMAAVSLVIVTYFGGQRLSSVALVGDFLSGILGAILIFVVPATIVVALKAVYALAKD